MAEQTLTVKIIGDESDLLRAFRRSSSATQRFSASFGTFVKGAVIFEGVRAGIQAVGNAARAGTAEFSQMERVSAQTQAVLKSTGGVANVTARDVGRLATNLSRLSGTDDEAIASAQNLILTFKNVRNELGQNNRIFDRTTRAALDLSVAAGGAFGDLDTTAKQLGKALNDPVRGMTALGRAGVTFTQKQRDTIKELVDTNRLLDAQKLILREVESQVGGSAEAFGNTLPGALAKIREGFRNAFGNLVQVVAQPLAGALTAFANFIPQIEAGVARIGAVVGPALDDLVGAFTARLPELQRIATTLLDPLRQHVFPILQEFAAIANRVWTNVVRVFDQNRESIGRILDNLAQVLANVWTVARPTIVFLFEKALPTALAIAIPILEKLTGVTKVMSQVFVQSVRVIVGALDAFLGGLSSLADAASHLPFIGDHFKGIADKVNASRESLRGFTKELDKIDGRTVTATVIVQSGGEGRALITRPNESEDESDKAVKAVKAQGDGARKVQSAATAAATVTKAALSAAERQRQAFDNLMEKIGLRRARAAETQTLNDDIRVARQTQDAILEQISVEGRTTELIGRLLDARQEQARLIQQRKRGNQFEELGLTAEGEQKVPGVGALRKRLASLRQQIKGTVLDTSQTKFRKRGIGQLIEGLGLSEAETKALRQRVAQMGIGGSVPGKGFGAFGMDISAPSTTAGGVVIENHLYIDGIEQQITKQQQLRKSRTAAQRRGVRPGIGGV